MHQLNLSLCSMFDQLEWLKMMVEQRLKWIKKSDNYKCKIIVHVFNLPKNVPTANGYNGTPMTGATKLMNQLGKKGVILKKRI